jgi:hypothetical protein
MGLTPALAARRSGRFQSASRTEIGLAPRGYAGVAPSPSFSLSRRVHGPLVLGERDAFRVQHPGCVAASREGDLSPQDWNRPERGTVKAAESSRTWGMN